MLRFPFTPSAPCRGTRDWTYNVPGPLCQCLILLVTGIHSCSLGPVGHIPLHLLWLVPDPLVCVSCSLVNLLGSSRSFLEWSPFGFKDRILGTSPLCLAIQASVETQRGHCGVYLHRLPDLAFQSLVEVAHCPEEDLLLLSSMVVKEVIHHGVGLLACSNLFHMLVSSLMC